MRMQPLTAVTILLLTALAGCADKEPVQYADPYPEPEEGTVPDVDFTFSATNPYTNTAFFFEDLTTVETGRVTDRMWEFGDGSTSNEKNPVHGYLQAGVFTVKLTVYTDFDLNASHEVSIVISEPPVEVNEYVDPNPLTATFDVDVRDLKVLFAGEVTNAEGTFVDFTWDFGDGTNAKTIAPVHHYEAAGQFLVSFTVSTSDGRSTTAQQWLNTTYPDPSAGEAAQSGEGERGYTHAGQHGSPTPLPLVADFTYKVSGLTVDFTSAIFNDNGFSINYYWELGVGGATSDLMHPLHEYPEMDTYDVRLTATAADGRTSTVQKPVKVFVEPEPTPHALIALSDGGLNVYHMDYYRPDAIHHPCTIFENFPCSVEELKLTVGTGDFDAAIEADNETLQELEPGNWYWIPKTVFSAVYCQPGFVPPGPIATNNATCIMRGPSGDQMASAILQEGPDVNLVVGPFREDPLPFQAEGFPFDIFVPGQISGGADQNTVPPACPTDPDMLRTVPVYVKPVHTTVNTGCFSQSPWVISVGGAYAGTQSSDSRTTGDYMDVVSYQCGPHVVGGDAFATDTNCVDANQGANQDQRTYAARVAGALGQSLYDIRFASGYAGGFTGAWADPGHGLLDPIVGVTVADLRRAMECSATYTPADQYGSTKTLSFPMDQNEPWNSWGWGFYDGTRVDHTVGFLQNNPSYPCDTTPAQENHMENDYDQRVAFYGENPPPPPNP